MRRASRVVPPSVALGLVLLAGCASFPEQAGPAPSWQPQPKMTEQAGPQPHLPGSADTGNAGPGNGGKSGPSTSIPPPKGCTDFDPSVIGTCLAPVAAVVGMPGGGSALAADRSTGRVLSVQKGSEPKQVAALEVDASADGGLTGLALSPTYREDQLVYAYITTATDNRVVRFALGDAPKPVLTGIPKGPRNNRGALSSDRTGALLVATGDAGNPAAASDPNSLAGKVLRIDGLGKPAVGNPTAGSAVLAAGLTAPGGLCSSLDGSSAWVTDRSDSADQLYKITAGQLTTPAWSWPDKPGVSGCAAFSNEVLVSTVHKTGLQMLVLNKNGSFNGKPTVVLDGDKGYGQVGSLDVLDEQTALLGTVNKDGGKPVSSDDRVVLLPKPNSADVRD